MFRFLFRRLPPWALPAVLALAAGSLACGGGEPAPGPGAAAVSDSAGIRIVVHRIPPGGIPDYASLSPSIEVEIAGGAEGPLVGIQRAVALSDGRIVVANTGDMQVRWYDRDGKFQLAGGGLGRDFGKFEELSRIGSFRGDSVWAYDVRHLRLTIFDPEGRAVLDAQSPGQEFVAGRFGDGSYLMVPGWTTRFHEEDPTDGVRRDPAVYHRWWPATPDSATVGTFPHNEVLVVENGPGQQTLGTPPFGSRTVRAVGPGRFYVGTQDDFEVRGYDPDGTLREILRLEGVDLSLTPQLVANARRLDGIDSTGTDPNEPFWDAVDERRPAYGELLLDALGNLWVGEHVANLTPPRNWIVFSPSLELRGMVRVPVNFRVFEVGSDYVLGAGPGPAGTEVVRRYGLARTP